MKQNKLLFLLAGLVFAWTNSYADVNADDYKLTHPFSVSATKKVYFSQGNLQYKASTNTWRFAPNQYDRVGNAAGNTAPSASQSNWIDLFGWATSGNSASNATGYQPYYTVTNNAHYGPSISSGEWTAANSDWGVVNAASLGAGWRTLTNAEWGYLFNSRTGDKASTVNGTANRIYTKATINTDETSVKGIILFPDGGTFAASEFTAVGSPNSSFANYTTTCTKAQWTALEGKGCVFLPAAGYRDGTSVYDVGSDGFYWSSSASSASYAYGLFFYSDNVHPQDNSRRYYGRSVRLVSEAAPRTPASVTAAPTANTLSYTGLAQELVTAGTASGGTMNYSLDNSTWSTSIPTATNIGDYIVYYKVVGDANHLDYTPSSNTVAVTINKAASVLTAAPTDLAQIYTGNAMTLINAGTATGGTMWYKLGMGDYSTDLPQATAIGDHTVYYKVIGDANHNDIDEASMTATILAPSAFALNDDVDNTAVLGELNGETLTLTINRTLSRDGYYSTLCLPFDLDAAAIPGSPLEDFVICELTAMSVSGDMLYLEMDVTDGIEAGKPYLVRYAGAPTTDVSPLVFSGVTVSASDGSNQAVTGAVMHGILEPTVLEQNNENVLFLAGNNTLKWNGTGSALRAFRAYFTVTGSPSLAPVHRGMSARIIEHHNAPTDIETVTGNPSPVTRKELRNGQLIIIRNGVEYNANGQLVK